MSRLGLPLSTVSPWGLLEAMGTLVAGAALLGFVGPVWWFFDLFSHFRVQYSIALCAVALILLVGRQWRAATIFVALTGLNLATIVPLYLGQPHESRNSLRTYRAMLVNVHSENERFADVEQAVRNYNPDILVLLEVSYDWLSALKGLHESHPHSVTRPREDNFGIALFSKFPLKHAEIIALAGIDLPSITAQIDLNGRPLRFLGTHTLPPAGAELSRLRNDHLAAIPVFLKNSPSTPLMILGDLNVTPWSSYFQRLLEQTGLRDCSQGRGVQPTWPAFQPIFLIPIDHCLHSTDVFILDKQVGQGIGSDHYPLVVDFTLALS